MSDPANINLRRVIELSREMLAIADEGDRDRSDDGCGIVFGVLRDAAYRLRAIAEEERRRHRDAGRWD
jgi:hypothetical protein